MFTKDVISRRIKELPDDSDTARALKQIEDLLSHVAHGGRYGSISKEKASELLKEVVKSKVDSLINL